MNHENNQAFILTLWFGAGAYAVASGVPRCPGRSATAAAKREAANVRAKRANKIRREAELEYLS